VEAYPFDEIDLGADCHYLIKNLIPRTGLTVIWGPPKSGKSFWTLDLMMHIALGWEYRGRQCCQGSVVYCAFEGQSGMKARVEAFRRRHLARLRQGARAGCIV
jgi:RecA-family ATPase